MTGNLWSELPDHWDLAQVKNVATVSLGKMLQSTDTGADVLASYLRAANVQPDGVLELSNVKEMWFSPDEVASLAVEPGDVVVVEGGQGGFGRAAYVPDGLSGWGFQNSINRVRPNRRVDGRYLTYYLIALRASGFLRAYCNVISMPHLTAEKLAALPVPLPPRAEQQAIADNLDHETAKIDTLIEEQQRLIDLLRERHDAVWSREFERLEETTTVLPLKRLIESLTDGPFGSALTSAHYVDEGTRVIRLGNIGINEFKTDDEAYISTDYAAKLCSYAVRAGDVVMAGLGDDKMPLGRTTVVPDIGPAIVKADCYRLRPSSGVNANYLAWVLSSPPVRSRVAVLARGSTRRRLNTSIVSRIAVPAPRLEEQRKAVDSATELLSGIEGLVAETERFIELAKERRSALITAAVTGQIDVPEDVA